MMFFFNIVHYFVLLQEILPALTKASLYFLQPESLSCYGVEDWTQMLTFRKKHALSIMLPFF